MTLAARNLKSGYNGERKTTFGYCGVALWQRKGLDMHVGPKREGGNGFMVLVLMSTAEISLG
jgi:hypothetical protein